MLRSLFKPRPAVEAGRALFAALADQARQPVFYAELGAADTVEGRFELYVLHLVLVLHRLKGGGAEAAETAQAVFDAFLKNLDEGLRDMGVGDLSVGKKMRRLGEAVYGRIRSYDKALQATASAAELEGVLQRTVFEGRDAPVAVGSLARYVADSARSLAGQPLDEVLACRLAWGEPRHG